MKKVLIWVFAIVTVLVIAYGAYNAGVNDTKNMVVEEIKSLPRQAQIDLFVAAEYGEDYCGMFDQFNGEKLVYGVYRRDDLTTRVSTVVIHYPVY